MVLESYRQKPKESYGFGSRIAKQSKELRCFWSALFWTPQKQWIITVLESCRQKTMNYKCFSSRVVTNKRIIRFVFSRRVVKNPRNYKGLRVAPSKAQGIMRVREWYRQTNLRN